MTALSIMRHFEPGSGAGIEGAIAWEGTDLLSLSEERMNDLRGSAIAMIFQDPLSSLDPVFSVGAQIMEPLMLHQNPSRTPARAHVAPIPDRHACGGGKAGMRLRGDVPSSINPPSGPFFHPRCPIATGICRKAAPARSDPGPAHWARCHLLSANPAGASQ